MGSLIDILEGVASELIAFGIISVSSGLFWSVRGKIMGEGISPHHALMWMFCFICLMVVIVFPLFGVKIPIIIAGVLPFVIGTLAIISRSDKQTS